MPGAVNTRFFVISEFGKIMKIRKFIVGFNGFNFYLLTTTKCKIGIKQNVITKFEKNDYSRN